MQNHCDTLFLSVKIDAKLRTQLDSSLASRKPLFNEKNSEFLQIMLIDDREYIGKVFKNGTTFDELCNILMNMKTMLKMICPKFSLANDTIKIIAVEL